MSLRNIETFYREANGWMMFDSNYLTSAVRDYLGAESVQLSLLASGQKPYDHFVEIGCGYGRFMEWSIAQNMRYDGLELVGWLADFGKNRIPRLSHKYPNSQMSVHNVPVEYIDHLGTH